MVSFSMIMGLLLAFALADRYGVSMTAVFTRACAFYLQHATGRDYEASTLTLP